MTIGSWFHKVGNSIDRVGHTIRSGWHHTIVDPPRRAQHHVSTVIHHTVVDPTKQKVLDPVKRTLHQHVIKAPSRIEHVVAKHLPAHLIPPPSQLLGGDPVDPINNEVVQRFLSDLNPDLGHAFDHYNLKDIVDKVTTEKAKEAIEYINPKEIWNDLTQDLETIYFKPTKTDALIGSNGTVNTTALASGYLDDNPSLRIEPILKIKKGAKFEITPDLHGDSGHLNLLEGTYTNGQKLDINFDINLPITIGLEATLTTKGEGAYQLPVGYTYNGGKEESEDKDGNKKSTNRWEVQFSDGIMSFAAGVNVDGELLVGEKAANSTYKFSATLDTDIVIKDMYELRFTENFSPKNALSGLNLNEKPKDFLSYLYDNKMVTIERSNELDGKKVNVSEIPVDEIFTEREWHLIHENVTNPSFGFDDLGIGVYIEPEVTFKAGLVLEENNIGLNVGSIGATAGLKLEYQAEDISGKPKSKLVTSLNGSITTDIMELNAGPISMAAYELPIWADSLVLNTVNL